MLRRWFCSLIVVVAAACSGASHPPVSAAPPKPTSAAPLAEAELVAIDMFGTKQVTLEQLLAKYGAELRAFGEGVMRGDHSVDTEALLDKLYALGDFADVTPALVGIHEPRGMKYYLTIDFVDTADAERRMPFLPAPQGTYADPEGLLADWNVYEQTMLAHSTKRGACPAFHCLGDESQQPALQKLARKFSARVQAHADELATILRDDRDRRHGAAAAYLLAYSKDGPWLVKTLVPAFRDVDGVVRNNAMRVVSDIATYYADVEVPIEPVLDALNYPATLDRNKAAAILDGLLSRRGSERLHHVIATRVGGTLVAMLRLKQPNNHDYAYRILKTISGQRFAERDYSAWEAWLRTQRI